MASKIVGAAVAVVLTAAIALGLAVAFPERLPASVSSWLSRVDATGPSFVLELDVADLRAQRLALLREDVRRALREGRIAGGSVVAGDVVEVRLREGVDRAQAIAKLKELLQADGQGVDVVAGEGGTIRIVPTEAASAEHLRNAIKDTVVVVERRLTEIGKSKPSVREEGPSRIVVRIAASQDIKSMIAVATRPGRLEFRLIDTSMTPEQALSGTPPPESEVLYDPDRVLPFLVEKRVLISGRDVADAQAAFDQRTNEPVVTFRFTAAGARRFGEITRDNVGRPLAIVLDNVVYSAPVIREPILGGSGQISGQFTPAQANEIAVLLRAGQLPARLIVVEQRADAGR